MLWLFFINLSCRGKVKQQTKSCAMVFVTTGIILAIIFVGWVTYRLVMKKPVKSDDIVAGVFFTIVFFAVLYFILQV